MTLIEHRTSRVTREAFASDPHAARYLGVMERHPEAFEQLVTLLNDARAEQLMEHESTADNAALRGIVRLLLIDPHLAAAIDDEQDGPRFRQALGVAIRLKMERLGWSTSGRKGPVGEGPFTRAEKYVRAPLPPPGDAGLALATLERVAAIGSDDERRETGKWLDSALRASRAEQGRPY